MPPAPAQLNFVSSLFSSHIFWAQVVTLAAMILSAAGVHVIDGAGAQEQAIGILDALATMALRLWLPTGPVSLTAPMSVPASMDVPAGAVVLHVPKPEDRAQTPTVSPLKQGIYVNSAARHEIEVTPAILRVVPAPPV